MVVADNALNAPVVVLLGAAGRLGQLLTRQLPQLGWVTIGVTRTGSALCPAAVDVTESHWSRPASWRSVVGGWPPVRSVVNLVTGREPDAAQAETCSRAAVTVMRAVADAAGGDPLMLHLGSIAEASPMPRSAYAAGKVAARQEAAADGRVAVITAAIVPRPRGAKADRSVRMLCWLSPSVARLPIPVTSGRTLARTLALVMGDRTAVGKQMVLAARPLPLGQVWGTRGLAGSLGDVAARVLVAAPTGRMLGVRARTLARAALGSAVIEHYAAATPSTADLVAPAPGQLVARRNNDGLGDWWLLPAHIGERQTAHV